MYDNSLKVQYSRITQKVVGISRQLKFPQTIPISEMHKALKSRFGAETSGPKFNYNFERNQMHQFAWSRNGQVVQTVRCDVSLLPVTIGDQNCGLAASSGFIMQGDYATGQSITVFDWSTFYDETQSANKSMAEQRQRQLDEAAKRPIPKL